MAEWLMLQLHWAAIGLLTPAVPVLHNVTVYKTVVKTTNVLRDSGPNWAEIATAVATCVLAFGAFAALRQIGEAKRSRHTEAAARMSSRWEADEYVDARDKIESYADDQDLRDAFLQSMSSRSVDRHLFLRELSFLEELGAMEKLGAISLRWVEETMGDLVLDRWDLWWPSIDALRAQQEDVYGNFQLLTEKLRGQSLTRRQRASRWLVKQLTY
ncbi:MAG: hypothetical protein ABSC90_08495 [Acidimicrobiales bacterium]